MVRGSWISEQSGCGYFRDASDKQQIILEPYTYMTSQPGKDFRTKLTAAFNDWLRVPEEQLTLIGKIVQMLHHASLLSVQLSHSWLKLSCIARIDDVEDDAQMRRGTPGQSGKGRRRTKIEYISLTSCAQDIRNSSDNKYRKLCLLPGVQGALRSSRPKWSKRATWRDRQWCVYTLGMPFKAHWRGVPEEFLNLHRGQGLEMYWRDSLQCPTEEEYLSMVSNSKWHVILCEWNLNLKLQRPVVYFDWPSNWWW